MVRKNLADYGSDDIFEELDNDKQEDVEVQSKEKNNITTPSHDIEDIDEDDYLAELVAKKPKYIQRSFEIKQETYKRMLKLANKYGHGFQKKFVNAALERELQRVENLTKRKK